MQTSRFIIFKIEFDISVSSWCYEDQYLSNKNNVPELSVPFPAVLRDLRNSGCTQLQSLLKLVGHQQTTAFFLLKEGSLTWLSIGSSFARCTSFLVLQVCHRGKGRGLSKVFRAVSFVMLTGAAWRPASWALSANQGDDRLSTVVRDVNFDGFSPALTVLRWQTKTTFFSQTWSIMKGRMRMLTHPVQWQIVCLRRRGTVRDLDNKYIRIYTRIKSPSAIGDSGGAVHRDIGYSTDQEFQ